MSEVDNTSPINVYPAEVSQPQTEQDQQQDQPQFSEQCHIPNEDSASNNNITDYNAYQQQDQSTTDIKTDNTPPQSLEGDQNASVANNTTAHVNSTNTVTDNQNNTNSNDNQNNPVDPTNVNPNNQNDNCNTTNDNNQVNNNQSNNTQVNNNQNNSNQGGFMNNRAAGPSQGYPGEWNCPKCTVLNYNRRLYCFKCNESRPAHIPVVNQFHNDGRERDRQYGGNNQFNEPAPSVPPPPAGPSSGPHWNIDPVDRSKCRWRNINHDNLVNIVTFSIPGDWICERENCHNHNYGNRTQCKQCSAQRTPKADEFYLEVMEKFPWLRKPGVRNNRQKNNFVPGNNFNGPNNNMNNNNRNNWNNNSNTGGWNNNNQNGNWNNNRGGFNQGGWNNGNFNQGGWNNNQGYNNQWNQGYNQWSNNQGNYNQGMYNNTGYNTAQGWDQSQQQNWNAGNNQWANTNVATMQNQWATPAVPAPTGGWGATPDASAWNSSATATATPAAAPVAPNTTGWGTTPAVQPTTTGTWDAQGSWGTNAGAWQ